jgi:uncharacterized Zn-finger protein
MSFPRSSALIGHKKLHGAKQYICSYCSRAFARPAYLREHVKTHTSEKPFVCSECGKSFAHSSTYRGHMKTHLKTTEQTEVKTFPGLSIVPEGEKENDSVSYTSCQQDSHTAR